MAMDIVQFREQIKFDKTETPPITRAKYLLFYVTRLSRLRNDMEPEVIAERLFDWGYKGINAQAIKAGFEEDPEVRESPTRQGAYELTQPAESRIKALLKGAEERMFQKTVLAFLLSIGLLAVVLLLGIIGYGLATYNKNVRDLSFPEFRKRLQFDESETAATDRAKYLLYFITKVIQLKPDMTAAVIADRLRDIGYSDVTEDAIRVAFQSDRQVRQSL